jgi:hypothetical protein
MARRRAQIEASVVRYLQQLDTANRQEPSSAPHLVVEPPKRAGFGLVQAEGPPNSTS